MRFQKSGTISTLETFNGIFLALSLIIGIIAFIAGISSLSSEDESSVITGAISAIVGFFLIITGLLYYFIGKLLTNWAYDAQITREAVIAIMKRLETSNSSVQGTSSSTSTDKNNNLQLPDL